jgi:hypothetical protein
MSYQFLFASEGFLQADNVLLPKRSQHLDFTERSLPDNSILCNGTHKFQVYVKFHQHCCMS